jgi:AraC-like DNA-binding protein
MASPSQVRIAIWEGGCLWIGRTLVPFDGDLHAHHALQLTFLLDGEFRISGDAGVSQGPVTLVDADVRHKLEAHGRAAFLFIEPESRAGRALRTRHATSSGIVTLPGQEFGDERAAIDRLWNEAASPNEMRAEGRRMTERLTGAETPRIDARVERIIAAIDEQPPGPVSFAAASAGVFLSPSRLRHLFAEQVGLPFKTYVLWRRVMKAVDALGEGAAITEAAHGAGFADGAHFSRTFRRTFGLSANALERL